MSRERSKPCVAIAIELQHTVPWHHDVFAGIMQYGSRHGWSCRVDPFLAGPVGQEDLSFYDGVVGRLDPELTELALHSGLPAVNLIPTRAPAELPEVCIDSYAGGRLMAQHLIASGYRRFGCVAQHGRNRSNPLIEGITSVLQEQGLDPPASTGLVIDLEASRSKNKTFRQMAAQWLAELDKPVGLVVMNITTSRYLAQTCLEIGLRVPEDVGIVVHDGDQVVVNNAFPTLSALDYDFRHQGYEAAAMLDRLMQGEPADPGERAEPERLRIPPRRVVIRESTDVFVCDDPLISEAMHFIAANLGLHLKVQQIAEHLRVSERTLRRRFEGVLGQPLSNEMKRIRTEHIQRLLAETDRSISEIAEACGFSSTSHFARYFKSAAGQTPSAYRKRYQQTHTHPADAPARRGA